MNRFVRAFKLYVKGYCPVTLAPHEWERLETPEYWSHPCEPMSYCYHFPVQCRDCEKVGVGGHSVEEVR